MIERLVQQGLDPAIGAEIRRVLDAAFDDPHDGDSLQDFCDGDYWFVGTDEREIVAVTGLLRREVVVGDSRVMIAGIGE